MGSGLRLDLERILRWILDWEWIWSGFWIRRGFGVHSRLGVDLLDSGCGVDVDWEWIWSGFRVDSGLEWTLDWDWIWNGFYLGSGCEMVSGESGFGIHSGFGMDLECIWDVLGQCLICIKDGQPNL